MIEIEKSIPKIYVCTFETHTRKGSLRVAFDVHIHRFESLSKNIRIPILIYLLTFMFSLC